MAATWIVTRVWRVEADRALDAIELTRNFDNHRVEVMEASLCPHPLAQRLGVYEHNTCIDCLRETEPG